MRFQKKPIAKKEEYANLQTKQLDGLSSSWISSLCRMNKIGVL
jgi:hypothetical protein